eukprot:1569798-Rhodomonas_salina.2
MSVPVLLSDTNSVPASQYQRGYQYCDQYRHHHLLPSPYPLSVPPTDPYAYAVRARLSATRRRSTSMAISYA